MARTYGVHSAMPMFQALRACPHATVIKPDMAKYVAVGRAVRAMMQDADALGGAAVDRRSVHGLCGHRIAAPRQPGRDFGGLGAAGWRDELSITVSIGLSYNKFLAKIASDLDKPRGFAVIGRAEARNFLADQPVGLLWGVGQAMRERLARDGITRIGELAELGEEALTLRYGRIGRRLALSARGEDDRQVSPNREAKSLSSEITLDRDIAELDKLRPILWQLAETVARRLKRAGLAAEGVTLKLKTADFRTLTRSRRLNGATQSPEVLFQRVEPLLAAEANGRAFRLIGIGAQGLVEADSLVQGDLFGGADPAGDRIDEAMDAVRARFGQKAIVKGRGLGVTLKRQGPSKIE